jgi:hypothetical protein
MVMSTKPLEDTPVAFDQEKEEWVTPEVTDYKAVTITRGISYRIGDGISNLT